MKTRTFSLHYRQWRCHGGLVGHVPRRTGFWSDRNSMRKSETRYLTPPLESKAYRGRLLWKNYCIRHQTGPIYLLAAVTAVWRLTADYLHGFTQLSGHPELTNHRDACYDKIICSWCIPKWVSYAHCLQTRAERPFAKEGEEATAETVIGSQFWPSLLPSRHHLPDCLIVTVLRRIWKCRFVFSIRIYIIASTWRSFRKVDMWSAD